MARNIEIKAISRNFLRLKAIVESISSSSEEIHQEDTFFVCNNGRLKLRVFSSNSAELIFYDRPNSREPKLSNYSIVKTSDPQTLKSLLMAAYGVRAVVKKKRLLFIVGQTRIHLDQVEGLGSFVELEVVLRSDQDLEEGRKIADELVQILEISESDLIDCAYVDLITSAEKLPT